VSAFDRGLDPGDQQNAPLPGIRFQVCAEGDGVVIGDAEDLKAGMLRPIDQFPCIVRDEALALPRVEMEIGSEFHACAPFSPTPPRG